MLSQRRFPAAPREVQAARREILSKIREKEPDDLMSPDLLGQKIANAHDKYLQREVQKKLKKTRYNWKQLEFGKVEEAAAFSLSRLVPYYAEVRKVLSEFDRNKFQPETILDYGSGTGSAFWAAREQWGDSFQEYCLVDSNDKISQFSMDVMRVKLIYCLHSRNKHLLPGMQHNGAWFNLKKGVLSTEPGALAPEEVRPRHSSSNVD